MYDFTVIVPVYNEEENLDRVEKELLDYLAMASKKTCILFINDGSTDNSLSLIKAMCARYEAFSYLSFIYNKGLSAALKAGFDHTTTPYLGYIDADLQTTPQDFELLLPQLGTYDLVTGLRADRKDSFLKNTSSTIANFIRQLFTKDAMKDTGCPLKVIKTEYAKRIPMFNGLHRFLPAMILLQQGKILQVPVRHFPRIAGTPKYGLSNRMIGPLIDCFAYLWMKKKYINYEIEK